MTSSARTSAGPDVFEATRREIPRNRKAHWMGGAVVGLACLMSACGAPQSAEYVAMGDSYVAGGGIEKTTTGCFRSDHNYPSLLAESLGYDSFDDVSCGGATTDLVLNGGAIFNGTKVDPQIDAVSANTELVTIGIGGNDQKFATKLVYACLIPPTNTLATCKKTVDGLTSAESLAAIQKDIVTTLNAIKDRAPDARIVLVGYLQLLPESGVCPVIGTKSDQIRLAASAEVALNDTLRQSAKEAEVHFVSLRALSEGHDACSDDPWVNGAKVPDGDGAPFHPRKAGMQAVADKLHTKLMTEVSPD